MNKDINLNIDTIQRNDVFSRKLISSGNISAQIFDEREVLSSNFPYTLLVCNHSNIFIKDTSFDTNLSTYTENENVVNILNTNQGKIFGNNITIRHGLNYNNFLLTEDIQLSTRLSDNSISTYYWNHNLSSLPPSTSAIIDGTKFDLTNTAYIKGIPINNIASINLDNSQTTIQSNNLSSFNLQNGRNKEQSFFNFPTPNDIKDYHIIPMMISNGERTIWSEGKYGYILEDRIKTIEDFLTYVPHDLNGQTFSFIITPEAISKINNLSSYYNGSLNIVRRGSNIVNREETNVISFDNLAILNCSIKITLSGFNFKKLVIKNSYKVYLNECSFMIDSQPKPMDEVEQEYSIYEWKKGNTDWVKNICLDIDNSKVFIQNSKTILKFSNFFIGMKINRSLIFVNTTIESNKIFLNLDLSNYTDRGNRPVFLLAYNGSRIYCNYKHIFVNIKYPTEQIYGYKPNTTENEITFRVNNNVNNTLNNNYLRAKSLLIALYEEVNNAKVFINAVMENNIIKFNDYVNIKNNNLDEGEPFHSIPSYGLYQVAKPHTGASDGWIANKNAMLLSGFESIDPDAEDKDLLSNNNLRIVRNDNGQSVGNGAYALYGVGYDDEKFSYGAAQPHLAHYFTYPEKTSGVIEMVIPNFDKQLSAIVITTYQKEKQ